MHLVLRTLISLLFAATLTRGETALAESSARVKALKITVLSTMVADRGKGAGDLGEWGFAALVEADGHRILFDTGAHTDVVQRNAETRGIDLTLVPDVVLSHSHWDHVGGFIPLRAAVMTNAPSALSRTHVAEGMFARRFMKGTGVPENPVLLLKPEYERTGGVFVVHANAVQLYPGVWLTGPVPRKHPERNWSPGVELETPSGRIEDHVPEDMSLICDTDEGLVVLTGCGHAGVVNIIEHARNTVRAARVHALIGGLHLFNAKDETLSWTAGKLRTFGVDYFLGGHCTGLETVYRYRSELGLQRERSVVAAVGSTFELGKGIDPGVIAK